MNNLLVEARRSPFWYHVSVGIRKRRPSNESDRSFVLDINDLDEPDRPFRRPGFGDESGIFVFGGGRGCAGRGSFNFPGFDELLA